MLARETLWISAIGLGFIGFFLELYSPEQRFTKWKMPWSKEGKIALEEDEEDETDGVDALDGGGAVRPRSDDGELESPVLTANFYERYVVRDLR